MKDLKIIYKPRGKAGEYADYAINLYNGCAHGCVYCYAPTCLHKTREQFSNPGTRKDVLKNLEADLKYLSTCPEKPKSVFLCFSCDPYQPIEKYFQISRQAIQMLHKAGISVMILTKGGRLAERDFDLLLAGDQFGVTLTCISQESSAKWEPNASLPADRISTLIDAHESGIRTWASLEPVVNPEDTLKLIRATWKYVDMYKVGVLNYHPHTQTINWPQFGREAKELLDSLGKKYYIKKDLQEYLK
jgi:DNA repair photolyase